MGNWCSDEVPYEEPKLSPDIYLDEDSVWTLKLFKVRFRCGFVEFTKRMTAFTTFTRSSRQIYCRVHARFEPKLFSCTTSVLLPFEVFPDVFMTITDINVLIKKLQSVDKRTNGQVSVLRPAINALRAQFDAICECIELEKGPNLLAKLQVTM